MIRYIKIILLGIALIALLSSLAVAQKNEGNAVRNESINKSEIRVSPSLSTADTCIARLDNGIVWQIDNWVYGNELYKNYIDPALVCENPYPYTIVEVCYADGFCGGYSSRGFGRYRRR